MPFPLPSAMLFISSPERDRVGCMNSLPLRNGSKERWVWNIESRQQKVENVRRVAGEELNIDPTVGSQSLCPAGILPNWCKYPSKGFPIGTIDSVVSDCKSKICFQLITGNCGLILHFYEFAVYSAVSRQQCSERANYDSPLSDAPFIFIDIIIMSATIFAGKRGDAVWPKGNSYCLDATNKYKETYKYPRLEVREFIRGDSPRENRCDADEGCYAIVHSTSLTSCAKLEVRLLGHHQMSKQRHRCQIFRQPIANVV